MIGQPDRIVPRLALRRHEAAESLGISATLFDRWIKEGKMPKGLKVDGVVLWAWRDLCEAWDRLCDNDNGPNPFDGVVA